MGIELSEPSRNAAPLEKTALETYVPLAKPSLIGFSRQQMAERLGELGTLPKQQRRIRAYAGRLLAAGESHSDGFISASGRHTDLRVAAAGCLEERRRQVLPAFRPPLTPKLTMEPAPFGSSRFASS